MRRCEDVVLSTTKKDAMSINTRGSILVTIRSRDLLNADSANSQGTMHLFESIVAQPNEILTVKLLSATFPNSWRNLSTHLENNTLSFKLQSDASFTTSTIPDGTYNILELMSEVKQVLESAISQSFTLTYNEITNEVTIKSSDATNNPIVFDFATSGCRRMLGFGSNTKTLNSSSGITSDRAVDITDTYNSIYVRLPNLSNHKVIESGSGKYSNIIAHIPVNFSRNTIFTYIPPIPFEIELNQNTISNIHVSVTFQDQTKRVEFGNADWELNLELGFRMRPQNEKVQRPLLNQTFLQQIKSTYDRLSQDKIKQGNLKLLAHHLKSSAK